MHGRVSPFARFRESRRIAGTDPLVPEADQPYFGPGFRLDYPYMSGGCPACHVPSADFSPTYGADPTTVSGAGAEGATCDICHKVWDVHLDPDAGMPDPMMPGILSCEFLRPPEGHQFFAGPLDDVAPGEDTFVPLQRESEYCAGCHYGVFWDTTVYNSFGEWLASPYSDSRTSQTCQDCHMPSGLSTRFARADKGGLERAAQTIASHRMRGVRDEVFMRDAVTVASSARREGSRAVVDVRITNDKTGHHVPTDGPLRHLMLLVDARDESGSALTQTEGPTLPEWCGVGNKADGYYAGLPGTAYAKILQEFRSAIDPTGAYWNPTRVLLDNRIPAFGSDETRYAFALPDSGEVTIAVKLLYRRAFIELAD